MSKIDRSGNARLSLITVDKQWEKPKKGRGAPEIKKKNQRSRGKNPRGGSSEGKIRYQS